MNDEPPITIEQAFRYVMTLLAGIGIGAAVVVISIYLAIQ